jgi:hypothetical protein
VRNVLVEIGVKSATNALTTVMIGSVGLLVVGLVYRRYRGTLVGIVGSVSRVTADAFRNSYQASKAYGHDIWSSTVKKAESYNPVTAVRKWKPPSMPSVPSLPSSLTPWKKNPTSSVPPSSPSPSSSSSTSSSSSSVSDGTKKAFGDTSKRVHDAWKKLQTHSTPSASSPPATTSSKMSSFPSPTPSESSGTGGSLPDAKFSMSKLSSSVSSTFSNLSSSVSSSLSSLQKDYLPQSKSSDEKEDEKKDHRKDEKKDEKKDSSKPTTDSSSRWSILPSNINIFPSDRISALSFSSIEKTIEKLKSSSNPSSVNQSSDSPQEKSPISHKDKEETSNNNEEVKSPSTSWKDDLTSFWKKKK